MCGPVGRVVIEALQGGLPARTTGMAIEAVAWPRASSKRPAKNNAFALPSSSACLAIDRQRIDGLNWFLTAAVGAR